MGDQVPVIVENPLVVCGSRKFQVDTLGDHLWVKRQQVVKTLGQHCGDIELVGYLTNTTGPVTLVLDLRVPHDRVDSSSDPPLNGHLYVTLII